MWIWQRRRLKVRSESEKVARIFKRFQKEVIEIEGSVHSSKHILNFVSFSMTFGFNFSYGDILLTICFFCRSALVAPRNIKDNASLGMSLGTILTCKSTERIMMNNRISNVKCKIAESLMVDIQNILDKTIVQGACDFAGISREAYATIFKLIREAFKQVQIRKVPIPRTYHLKKERDTLNIGMHKITGTPFHIEEVYETDGRSIFYNSSNNLFVDLNYLLRYIVTFYDITYEKVNGKIIIVLKLDESEIVKGQKMERVSITLMNGALSQTENQEDFRFSVQSENDIWWLAAFQVTSLIITLHSLNSINTL